MALADVSSALDNDLTVVRDALARLGDSAAAVRAVAAVADHPLVVAAAEAVTGAIDPAAEPLIAGLVTSLQAVARAFPAPAPPAEAEQPAEEAPAA